MINQKYELVFAEDEICVPIIPLNFNDKMCVGKHVSDTVLHNTSHSDEPDFASSEDILQVLSTYENIIRYS